MSTSGHQAHRRFPGLLAFTLNNRIRRHLEPPEKLISKLNLRPSDVVLDFGCGPGFFTVPPARVVSRTIAADVSSGMLVKTASSARKSRVTVELVESDGADLKLQNESVDVIFLNHVFHEITNRPRVLGEFLRILKRLGMVTVVERTRGGPLAGRLGPPIIDQAEAIRELERAGFTLDQTISHGNDSIIVARKV